MSTGSIAGYLTSFLRNGLVVGLATTAACTHPTATARPDAARDGGGAPRSLFLGDLTSPELQAAIRSGYKTALVYSGGTEGNGPHLALGKHNYRAEYYAERIARELGHALVGEVVRFGMSSEDLAGLPGTIAVRSGTFAALHEDIVRSLARAGFTRIVLLTEHGPNVETLLALAPRLDAELAPKGARVLISTDNYTKSNAEIEAWGRTRGIFAGRHGGFSDTSELWFVNPTKVRPELIALGDTSAGAITTPERQVIGDPRNSSVEFGRLFADIRVRNSVAELRRLLSPLQ